MGPFRHGCHAQIDLLFRYLNYFEPWSKWLSSRIIRGQFPRITRGQLPSSCGKVPHQSPRFRF